ncbi:hypothetical protein BZB76_5002 [Actinomadura pelletieri DSM 43383]|uniref:Uncharacterized protein n=1 Tax=Actinomadura pelletieri DSM 43383 TaxID=1120940 RepID=A0A495QJ58_9ACTN|nr:hypothetical protein BZB76_5002 [Actinomadura pelletieri DSM 43383]
MSPFAVGGLDVGILVDAMFVLVEMLHGDDPPAP